MRKRIGVGKLHILKKMYIRIIYYCSTVIERERQCSSVTSVNLQSTIYRDGMMCQCVKDRVLFHIRNARVRVLHLAGRVSLTR